MSSAADSFAVVTNDARSLVRPMREAHGKVSAARAGFVFVAGTLGRELVQVARVVSTAWPGVPTLIGASAGVMTERGEIEGQAAATGLLTSGGRATAVSVPPGSADEVVRSLGAEVDAITAGRSATLVLLASPMGWSTAILDGLSATRPGLRILGGGTPNEAGPVVVDAAGNIAQGQLAGLVLTSTSSPRVVASPGCKLLGNLMAITETRGGMILRIDDEPALDVLTRATQGLDGRPLVVALLAERGTSAEAVRSMPMRNSRIRPIRGVDPSRKGIVLGEPVGEGAMLGFAVLDGTAARGHMETSLRELSRDTAGAAARFGLYFNCAGRGSGLYGNADVDSKMLRARFERLPIAGMMSSFEIAPTPERAAVHFYTGVFGLFTSPS